MCMLDDQTLICGQSYGYIDIVRVSRDRASGRVQLNMLLKTKFDQISHIYTMQRTSRLGEFIIGGYDGIYFGQISDGHIGVSTEQFLVGRTVKTVREYAPDKLLVGIDNFPAYLFIDRVARNGFNQIREIQTDEVRTRCTFLHQINTCHPLYLARNALSVDIINVATGQVVPLVKTEMTDR